LTVVRVRRSGGWEDLTTVATAEAYFEPWHEVGAAGEPAFGSGWTNTGGGAPTLAFRKTPDGRVQFKGVVTPAAGAAAVAFTLPVGYRPSVPIYLPLMAYKAGAGHFAVNGSIATDGTVTPIAHDAAGIRAFAWGWVTFEGAEFPTTQATFPVGPIGPTGPAGRSGELQAAMRLYQCATTTMTAGAWMKMKLSGAAASRIDPADAFTVNADDSISVKDEGWYDVAASLLDNAGASSTVWIAIDTDATPSDGAIANSSGGAGTVNRVGASGSVYLLPTDRVYVHGYSSAASTTMRVWNLSVTRVGAGPPGLGGGGGGGSGLPEVHVATSAPSPRADEVLWIDTDAPSPAGSVYVSPPLVTSLPAAPVSGQQVVYVADATNGVLWTLRYNAGSASPYKWEFVGGSPLTLTDVTSNTITTIQPTWANLPTSPATVGWTAPLAGDYIVQYGMQADNAAEGQQAMLGFTDPGGTYEILNHRSNNWTAAHRTVRHNGQTAGYFHRAQGRTTQSGARILRVELAWWPVRVG
jgi:hypothetical protein